MLDTNLVPLAAIDEVAVRQVLAVRADEKRYVSPAIGTSFLRTIRPRTDRSGEPELTYPDYVRDRILHLADGARRRTGDGEPPARPPRSGPGPRSPAWSSPPSASSSRSPRLTWVAPFEPCARPSRDARPASTIERQIPSARFTSALMASRRPAAEMRAASTPSSGCTGTTTSR